MSQPALFNESIDDALRSAVAFLGGYKKVGAAMRPEKPADLAGNWLRDCLTDGRREVLDPGQVVWIMRAAAQAGYHGIAAFINETCGYAAPEVVEPETELAKLLRQVDELRNRASDDLARAERIAALLTRSNVESLAGRRA